MMKRVRVRRAAADEEQIMEGAIDIVFLLLIFFVMTSSFQILTIKRFTSKSLTPVNVLFALVVTFNPLPSK